MVTVEFTTVHRSMSPLGPEGELVLDGGGGRLPTTEEEALLAVGRDHMSRPPSVLPYRYQDSYGRELEVVQQRAVILDNGRLRATFLLDQGGRLLALRDLGADRELLHQGDALQHANLALRNAWFAGGIEWNLGTTGHWGLSCEPVCAGVVDGDVLRMWAHERLLGVTWRLDAWLEDGADALFTHAVIANETGEDLPVYWWSNIAVPQDEHTRVLVDADRAFHFGYASRLREVGVPLRDGVDISRPQRHPGCADYFYDTADEHPWIAAVGADGYGLGQASTTMLTGRKLFTWGDGPGGRTWQNWLSGSTSYAEIQAGLARTQLEHLRLRPGRSWRFTESYRPVHVDEADGPWSEAVAGARDATVDAQQLERAHAHLSGLEARAVEADASAARGGSRAQGWGALEVAAGHRRADPATPFDADHMDEEQCAWLDLARRGTVSPLLQRSALVGPRWRSRLEQADPGWLRDLLLGHAEHAAGNTGRARELWGASATTHQTPDVLRALALTTNDPAARAQGLVRAHRVDPGRAGLAIEALSTLLEVSRVDEILTVIDALPTAVHEHPRLAYLECFARVRAGDLAGARELIMRPLTLPDLREGDLALDQLWGEYQRLARTDEPLPAHYDFRMAVAPLDASGALETSQSPLGSAQTPAAAARGPVGPSSAHH